MWGQDWECNPLPWPSAPAEVLRGAGVPHQYHVLQREPAGGLAEQTHSGSATRTLRTSAWTLFRRRAAVSFPRRTRLAQATSLHHLWLKHTRKCWPESHPSRFTLTKSACADATLTSEIVPEQGSRRHPQRSRHPRKHAPAARYREPRGGWPDELERERRAWRRARCRHVLGRHARRRHARRRHPRHRHDERCCSRLRRARTQQLLTWRRSSAW